MTRHIPYTFIFFLLCGISSARGDTDQITELTINGATREQPLHDIAGSATILFPSQEGVTQDTNFQNVLESLPGIFWSGGSARPRFFQVRGVGELEQYTGAPNPSVGVVVDDVDISGLGVATALFDVERVEVLRGPQGIRFGSNALAGLVHVVPEEPTRSGSGRLQLSLGSDNLVDGGVAAGGPIGFLTDDWQFRFSTSRHSSDGFRYNRYYNSDSTNERGEFTTRMKVRYEPSEDLTTDLSGFVVNNDNGYDLFAIDNSLDTESDRPGRDLLNLRAGAFKVVARPSSQWAIVSTTTRYLSAHQYSFDGDWGNNEFWQPYTPYDFFEESQRSRSVTTQEVRVVSDDRHAEHGVAWQWMMGGSLQRFREQATIEQSADGAIYNSLDSRYHQNTGAIFGEVEIPLRAGSSVRLGGRQEHRDFRYEDSSGGDFDPSKDLWGGTISFNHDLSKEVRVYTLASRGFKGGGVNPGARVPESRRLYEPEVLWNFEGGMKGVWFDGDLTTNVALFRALRRNSQLKRAFQDDPSDPLAFTYITESRGRGELAGLELEAGYRINRWLTVEGAAASLFTRYTTVPDELGDLRYRRFAHAPKWSYSIGGRAEITESLFLTVDFSGKGSFFFDDSHNKRSNPYSLANAALGYRFGRWVWSLWGRNLTDEKFATRGFFFGNEPPDFPNKLYIQRGDPLQIGTTLSYSF